MCKISDMWPPEGWQPKGEKPRVVEFISELTWVWALFTWLSLFQFPSDYNFLPQCLWFADLIFKWCSVASPSLSMFFLFFHLYYCLKVPIHQLIFQLYSLSSTGFSPGLTLSAEFFSIYWGLLLKISLWFSPFFLSVSIQEFIHVLSFFI